MRDAYSAMDASGTLSLDLAELSPFLQYSFAILFGVELAPIQAEELFLIVDTDHSTEVKICNFAVCDFKFTFSYF
jgi:hypothetical protein